MAFYNNPGLKKKKLEAINFERVKNLRNYLVPRLNAYDVLSGIYEADGDTERLQWLQDIGSHIGYIDGAVVAPAEAKPTFDHEATTRGIEVHKSGQQGKLAFLDSKGEPCSTGAASKDDAEQKGWRVMRAEVSFSAGYVLSDLLG